MGTTPPADPNPYFGPRSVLRRTAGEAVLLLSGGRALLFQIAHPLVAAGVAEHSRFRQDPLGRLDRTLDMMLAMVVGSGRQADAALRRFRAIHIPVRGRLDRPLGPFAAGTPYSGHDPELKLWVHSTLMDSTLVAYQRFVRPLSPAERDSYFRDAARLAMLMGIPEETVPGTEAEHRRYMEGMLGSGVLVVDQVARSIAREVLHPDVWLLPRALGVVARFGTTGLLPEALRRAYGLEWDGRREAALGVLAFSIRLGLPAVPRSLRLLPQAGGSDLLLRIIRHGRG